MGKGNFDSLLVGMKTQDFFVKDAVAKMRRLHGRRHWWQVLYVKLTMKTQNSRTGWYEKESS